MKLETKKYRSSETGETSIIIRRATKRDVPAMLKNLAMVAAEEVYIGTEEVTPRRRKEILDRMRDRNNLTIVAVVDGKVVGNSTLWHTPLKKMKHVRELGILVIDGYREMGVGRALMDYDIKWARKQDGIEKVELGVFSPNKRAIHVYEKFGFKIEGVLKKQHILKGKYADELRMALFLKR